MRTSELAVFSSATVRYNVPCSGLTYKNRIIDIHTNEMKEALVRFYNMLPPFFLFQINHTLFISHFLLFFPKSTHSHLKVAIDVSIFVGEILKVSLLNLPHDLIPVLHKYICVCVEMLFSFCSFYISILFSLYYF